MIGFRGHYRVHNCIIRSTVIICSFSIIMLRGLRQSSDHYTASIQCIYIFFSSRDLG